ncbi:MAG: HEPN domain-containing protein [Deltaproteobacteria bacterium]|nr:HEPN domain-containing protein [Deltaproteobacteria bacterium]
MDKKARLEGARQALAGARALLEHEDSRGCVSRCYYAAYQAMWAAVGDPEKKPRWEHFGIIKIFVRGNWLDPQAASKGPGVFERQRFALRRLYDLRLGADYRLDDITRREAQWAIEIAQEIITLSEQKEIQDGTTDKES